MSIRQLEWFEDPTCCTEEQILSVENDLGVRFPNDYREFLLNGAGGSPLETDFKVDDSRGRGDVSIGVFLSPDDSDYGILPTMRIVAERSTVGLVPIAESGGGDFICLDYRRSSTPTISYWHQGRYGENDEFVAVCDTFEDFLNLLQVPDDH
jgi:SMI1-KNR4 cell-wall